MPHETTKGRQELLQAVMRELDVLTAEEGRDPDPHARTRPAIRSAIDARLREGDAFARARVATAETLPSGEIARAAPPSPERAGRYSYVSSRRSERR